MRNPFKVISWFAVNGNFDQYSVLFREMQALKTNKIRILDIGAGPATVWQKPDFLKLIRDREAEITLLDATEEVPLPKNLPGVIFCRKIGVAPDSLRDFEDNSFDFVLAFDIIEHLPKHDGYKLLYEINRICKATSVIFTPNGFVWQPPSSNNLFNNHVSGWMPSELRMMGWYRTYGHTGFRRNFGPYGIEEPTKLPKFISRELRSIGTIIVYRIPKLAFSFTAVSRKKRLGIVHQDFGTAQ